MRLYPNKLVSHFLTISGSQHDSPTPSGGPRFVSRAIRRIAGAARHRPCGGALDEGLVRLTRLSAPPGRARPQSTANRPPGGIRATKRSPPNGSPCRVQDSAENEQRAKPDQEHSRISIHRCRAQEADCGRIVPAAGTIVAVRVLDRPARINLRAFPTKRTVSGSPPGPSAFTGD